MFQSLASDGQARGLADPGPLLCVFSVNVFTGETTCKCRPILIGMLVNTTRITFKVPEADCPQILTVTDEDRVERAMKKLLKGNPRFIPIPMHPVLEKRSYLSHL